MGCAAQESASVHVNDLQGTEKTCWLTHGMYTYYTTGDRLHTCYINGYNHHFQLGIAYLSSSMKWVKVFNPEEQGWCTSVPCLHSTLTTVWPAVFLYSDTSIRLEMKKPPVVACLCLKQKLQTNILPEVWEKCVFSLIWNTTTNFRLTLFNLHN